MMRPVRTAPTRGGMAEKRPLVSVVIPVFNLEDFLAEAIDSVLGQTWRDFEIILIDDGSTDRSRSLIEGYRSRSPERVRAVFLPHRGASATRNAGIDAALGEWIAFLDGDDVWKPAKLAEQMRLAAEDPRCNFIAGAAEILGKDTLFHIFPPSPFDLRLELLRRGCFITLSTVLIRRDLLTGYRFAEELEGAQEFDLFLRMADRVRIGIIAAPLILYRVRETAISGMTGGRFLQVHRHFQIVRRELERLVREDPARLRPYRGEIRSVARRLAHEAAYYALMNPRSSLLFRLKLAFIAIRERPLSLKNSRLLLQSFLPAEVNRRLSQIRHRPPV